MSQHYQFNTADVADWIAGSVASFGFTSTLEGRALGTVLVDTTVDGIFTRSRDRQCDGDGSPWPENSQLRREEKERRLGKCLTNFDTGQMISVNSLKGTVAVSSDLIEIKYGTGEYAERPRHVPKRYSRLNRWQGPSKEPITDVDKAAFAEQQGRSFFEFDDEICDRNFEKFGDALTAHLQRKTH